jgi:hypothetical protein
MIYSNAKFFLTNILFHNCIPKPVKARLQPMGGMP